MIGYIIYNDIEYTFEYEKNIINIYTKDITELYNNLLETDDTKVGNYKLLSKDLDYTVMNIK